MAIKKKQVSPRQKMINLMYVVLMAMLALNVSEEVLDGFAIVNESLSSTTDNSSKENLSLYDAFRTELENNPEKAKEWFDKAQIVRSASDSLYNLLQELKIEIVKETDGDDGDVNDIKNRENLEAASHVMLGVGTGKGEKLRLAVDRYRELILGLTNDDNQKKIIGNNLSTTVPSNKRSQGKNWEEYLFENIPAGAAVTMLTKLQSDVRYAEGEILHTLITNIGVKDLKVNKIEAMVVPDASKVQDGDLFSAKIVMAAVDTTQRPEIYVNGVKVGLANDDKYSFVAHGVGEKSFSGYITQKDVNGGIIRRNFDYRYTVLPAGELKKEDKAVEEKHPVGEAPKPPVLPKIGTLTADLMNVLYAGYDNPMSVSVSGANHDDISLTMTGGSLSKVGSGKFIARPTTVGQNAVFSVSVGGTEIGTFTYKVRKLPDPTPYIPMGTDRFKGGAFSKASLMGASGIKAAIDDGLLDIEFAVQSFETVFFDNMGNAKPLRSEGSSFSAAQKAQFRQLSSGKRFYITGVIAVGPDNITRKLPTSMEIRVK